MSGLFGERVDIEKAVVGVMGGWGNRRRGWCQAIEWVLFTFGAKKGEKTVRTIVHPQQLPPSKPSSTPVGVWCPLGWPPVVLFLRFQEARKAKAESNKSNQGAQQPASLCLGAPAAESRSWPAQTWLPPCSMENLGKKRTKANGKVGMPHFVFPACAASEKKEGKAEPTCQCLGSPLHSIWFPCFGK